MFSSSDNDVTLLGVGMSQLVTSRLHPKFKIDPFVIESNFVEFTRRFMSIIKETRASVQIQRMLLLQALSESMMDQFWDLCLEKNGLYENLNFFKTMYKVDMEVKSASEHPSG